MTNDERNALPPTCQWHADEISSIRHEAAEQSKTIAGLVTDVKMLTTRIPVDLAVMLNTVQLQVGQALSAIQTVDTKVTEGYVKREEFEAHVNRYLLIERLVFGTVGLICLTVLTALIYSVVKRGTL
jgi:hypothetical protein